MSLLDTVLARLGYIKAQRYPDWALAYAEANKWAIPDGSQHEVQARLYRQLDWIATAIDVRSETAALTPFDVKRRQSEDSVDIPNHPFELLLQRPNPVQSRAQFLRDYFAWYALTGNVYLYLNVADEDSPPDELWIIPSNLCRPIPDGRSYISHYEVRAGRGPPEKLEPWRVSHLASFNPFNRFIGMSAVESLSLSATADRAEQEWKASFFAKDNAKIPGILAFAQMMNNDAWDLLKREAKDQWGGTKRGGPMFLRGVGTGGVSWLPTAMTQREMQFIADRNFTKEEIWARLAPGLASIVAVNATEANALAGKATLLEYSVWPVLVQAAQKITSDILVRYDPDLVGEFEDVRAANRLLDLEEQQRYEATHTIDEIRNEYYGDDELGDERGGMLPAQISPTIFTSSTASPAEEVQATPQEEAAMPLPTVEAVRAELAAWERFALKRLGKPRGRAFEPHAIPLLQVARIQAALKEAESVEAIRMLFARERLGDFSDLVIALREVTTAMKETI